MYFLYAMGEIVLVVIGILIALQINNWNENRKNREFERYVLTVVESNLEEDARQITGILENRGETTEAIGRLENGDFQRFTEAELSADIANILTFDRFFSIDNGYELIKSKGLIITDEALRTQLGRYYEYEVNIVNSSIQDIEKYFMENTESMIQKGYFENVEYGEYITLADYTEPQLERDIILYIRNLKENHKGTVAQVEAFSQVNEELKASVGKALRELN